MWVFSKINIRWIPQQSRDEFVVSLTDDEELTFLPPPLSFPHIVQRGRKLILGDPLVYTSVLRKKKKIPQSFTKSGVKLKFFRLFFNIFYFFV